MTLRLPTLYHPKKKAEPLTLLTLMLVFVILTSLFLTIDTARADPTEYTYFREFSFGGFLGNVTTRLNFFADPDVNLSPIPDFTKLSSFSWNVSQVSTMSGADITAAPCTTCQFDLTDPTSDSNINFALGSGTIYTLGTVEIRLTELRGGSVQGTPPALFLGNPPSQSSALGTKASWTAIPSGTLPGPRPSPQPIPEPATVWLMLTGLVGLGAYTLVRRRPGSSIIHQEQAKRSLR